MKKYIFAFVFMFCSIAHAEVVIEVHNACKHSSQEYTVKSYSGSLVIPQFNDWRCVVETNSIEQDQQWGSEDEHMGIMAINLTKKTKNGVC